MMYFKKIIDIITLAYFYFYLGLFITDYSFIFSFLHARAGLGLDRVSNIAGPTLGLMLLILTGYFLDRESFKDTKFASICRTIAGYSDKTLLSFAVTALFIIFASLSIARHFSLSSGAWDLGLFDQAVWNVSQGNALLSSVKYNINLLGDHFEPILFLVAPLYRIWSSPLVLLILQSLLLSLAIVPLYLIARNNLKARPLVFAFIISYMLSRPLRGIALFDFHPECFILLLLFWAYYFLIEKKNLLLSLSLFLLILCKEDTAFLISGLGIFAYFFQKRRGLGAVLFIAGILLWVVTTQIVISHFSPEHGYYYMNRLPFGNTYQDNVWAVINNPSLLKHFVTPEKIEYIVKLFSPTGFLSLLSPAHYILIFIPLFKNLIPRPEFSGWYQIASFYTAGIIPFIYISAIYGAARLAGIFKHKKAPLLLSALVVLSSLLFYGKTDGYKFIRFLSTIRNERTLEKLSYLKIIPREASVAANFNLVPHLSERKYIFEWVPRSKIDGITDYIVLDTTLLEYLSTDTAYVKKTTEESLVGFARKGYNLVFSNPRQNFFIFHNPGIDKSLAAKISSI